MTVDQVPHISNTSTGLNGAKARNERSGFRRFAVPKAGLEPAQPYGHTPLKRARLPIPPLR